MGKNTSVVLGEVHEAFIRRQIEKGRFGSASEVIRAAVHALMERDEAATRWLEEEVGPVYDAMTADPGSAIPLDEAFKAVKSQGQKSKAA